MYLTIIDQLHTHARNEYRFLVRMTHAEIIVDLDTYIEAKRAPKARRWLMQGKFARRVHEQRSLAPEQHRERPDIPPHVRDKVLAQLNMLTRVAL